MKKAKSEFECEFCHVPFVSEANYLKHACDKKKRWQRKDDRDVRTALIAYSQFWAFSYPRSKPRTITDFINSKQFNDFVRLGKFINDNVVVNQNGFIQYVVKSGKPITDWYTDRMRNEFHRHCSQHENHEDAIARSFMVMEQWATKKGENFCDFFRKIEPALAVLWIQTGKISPWVFYTAPSVQSDLLPRMSEEQMNLIQGAIDPGFWKHKISHNRDIIEHIIAVLKGNGL